MYVTEDQQSRKETGLQQLIADTNQIGLDRYRYRVSADTYFSIGADTSSSFTCLNSQHCCMYAYSFKPIVCLIHFET